MESALHRIPARLSLRHQPRRGGRSGAVGLHLEPGVPRELRHCGANPLAVRGAGDRVRHRAADRLGHRRSLLSRAARRGLRAGHRIVALLHLRERIRSQRHGKVPRVFGADLLAVLHPGITLSRCVQAARPGGAAAQGPAGQNPSNASRHSPRLPLRKFHRYRAPLQPGHRLVARHHLSRARRRHGGRGDGEGDVVAGVPEPRDTLVRPAARPPC
jgi:hypothetical protein